MGNRNSWLGGLAAALSTAAGLLLVISASISHDLMKKIFLPGITDKQELMFARFSAALAVSIAGYFGVYPPGFVAQVVAFAFGLAAASFFPTFSAPVCWSSMRRSYSVISARVRVTGSRPDFFTIVRRMSVAASPTPSTLLGVLFSNVSMATAYAGPLYAAPSSSRRPVSSVRVTSSFTAPVVVGVHPAASHAIARNASMDIKEPFIALLIVTSASLELMPPESGSVRGRVIDSMGPKTV
jgi:cation/acetate symporter